MVASKTSMKSLRTSLVRFYTFFVMKTWGRVCVCVLLELKSRVKVVQVNTSPSSPTPSEEISQLFFLTPLQNEPIYKLNSKPMPTDNTT